MKFILDGLQIEVAGKKTILEVAREREVTIPSLCEHPRLVPFTGCRLCIVEVKGRKGVAPACGTYIEDGMEVTTSTPDIQKMRRQILELILSEHPSACLICSEKNACRDFKSTIRKVGEVTGCVLCSNNGRCDLQKAVEYLYVDKVGFPAVYRDLDIDKNDPFFERNYNLCILCGRCVRICHEVRGASAIAFVNRGSKTVIGTALGRRLLDSGCEFCGACVDVCPTGALTEKAVKYETLPDAEKAVICAFCGQGCELTIELNQGKILDSIPAEKGAVNQGQACVRGRFLVREAVYHPRRVLKPMVRRNGTLEETGWDEALGLVARRFAEIRPQDVAFIDSVQDSCEDIYSLRKFAREGLKTENVTGAEAFSPQARLLEMAGEQSFLPSLNYRISDIGKARAIFLFGVPPPIVGIEIYRAVRNDARLVVVGGAGSCHIRCASAWIHVPPEKEGDLLTGLSKVLFEFETGNFAEAQGVDGFAGFKKRLDDFKLADAVSSRFPEDKLRKLALILEKRKPVAFLFDASLGEGRSGKVNIAALWNLALQTQGRLFPLGVESNVRGALEIANSFQAGVSGPERISRAIPDGAYKALYLAGPLPKLEKRPAEFVVVQGCFLSDYCDFADVILPQTTFAESEGTFVNIEGRVQKSDPAVAPLGESKPGWRIVSDLARKMGLSGFAHQSARAVFDEMAGTVPAFQGLSGDCLKPDAFVHESGRDGRAFAVRTPAAEEAAYFHEHDADYYKGLAMSREIKGLNLIRGRK